VTGRRALTAFALALLLPPAATRAQSGVIDGTVTGNTARIRDVVVYLIPDAASGAQSVPTLKAEMDQRELAFVPRVVTVTPGSTVVFFNSDRVRHNVFSPPQRGNGFDLGTWPPGESRSFTFGAEGAYAILCHVHPEMVGYVVVVASRHRAVTDDQGRFRLDGVAPGTYRLRTWHRRWQTQEQRVTVVRSGSARIELSLRYGSAGEPTTNP
jgi:plastocyanin